MLMPQNPKVAIIDDNYEEIEEIIQTFSENGVPYIYLNGKRKFIPNHSFDSLRFIILDIDLGDLTASQTGNNLASVIANLVSNLIALKKQPYYIIFWTKNNDLCDKIIEYLRAVEKNPIGVLNWEKSETLQDFTVNKIKEKINELIDKDCYEYLIAWENSINRATSNFVNELVSVFSFPEQDWNDSFRNLLSKLACCWLDEKALGKPKESLPFATQLLNQSFSNLIDDYKDNNVSVNLPQKPTLDIRIIARLNRKLFFDKIDDNFSIKSGNIFVTKNENLLNILKTYKKFKTFYDIANATKLCGIIMTPSCDIAQNKILGLQGNPRKECHRILYGILFEFTEGDFETFESALKNFQHADCLFVIQPFFDDNKVCIILFHFATLTNEVISKGEIEFKYKLSEPLSFDLQSKLSNHVNRLGNSMLLL